MDTVLSSAEREIRDSLGLSLEQVEGLAGPFHVNSGRLLDTAKRLNALRLVAGVQEAKLSISEGDALSIILSAANTEHDDLRDRFLKLLVNALDARSDIKVHKSFALALQNFEVTELRIMETVYPNVGYTELANEFWTKELPERVQFNKPPDEDIRPPLPVEFAVSNLLRLGCLTTALAFSGINNALCVSPTVFGWMLARAFRM